MVNSVEGFLEDIGQNEEGKQNGKEGSKKADSASFSIDSDAGVPALEDGKSPHEAPQPGKSDPKPETAQNAKLDFGEFNYLMEPSGGDNAHLTIQTNPLLAQKQKSASPSVPQLTHQESEASSSVQIVEDAAESPVVVVPDPAEIEAVPPELNKQASPSRI